MRIRVGWRRSLNLTGTIVKWLVVPLCLPIPVAFYYGESVGPFLAAIGVSLLVGVGLERPRTDKDLGPQEAFLMVAMTWLLVAVIGAIPFVVGGNGNLDQPINAVFESMSGLTTTGATILTSFDQPRSVLFWRQLIQWLGGLGILILATALLSRLSVGGAQLMETETQYRNVDKLTPYIESTARLIGGLYLGLTVLTILVLYGLHVVGLATENMTFYNAVAHALTSVSTAGFSPEGKSIEAFAPIVQWVLMPVMFLGSTSFVLIYFVLQGRFDRLRNSEEFRFYLGSILLFSTFVIAVLVWQGNPTGDGLHDSVRQGLFNVVSIITTTGYANADFARWSPFAQHLLFLCMFLGGMAGSTSCSIKSLRWLVIFKSFRRDLFTAAHPEAIRPVRMTEGPIDEETIRDVYAYTLLAIVAVFLFTVVIVIDGARTDLYDSGLDEFDAMGAAASTVLNIGPAFGPAGPYGSYDVFPSTTKVAMILLMWIGRIEFIPVLVLLSPAFWRS